MKQQEEYLRDLKEIRSLMERSSRFISLSGLSGVFAGLYALAGAGAAWWYMNFRWWELRNSVTYEGDLNDDALLFFFADAALVLFLSVATALFQSWRKAKQKGVALWDKTAYHLLVNLLLPLVTGGLFGLILIYHGYYGFVAPITLLFYGLALLNASRYTLHDIRYLGLCEIALGLLSAFYMGFGLLFWTIGFGVLHIVYGLLMYLKYER